MKYKPFFLTMLAMVFLSSVTALVAPFLLQAWSRDTQRAPLTFQRILLLVSVIFASKVLSVGLTVYRERFAKEFNKKNFLSMLNDAFYMSYDEILKEGPTHLLERIALAVESIYSHMTGGFLEIWSGIGVALICLLLIAGVQTWLAALLFVALPLNYFGFRALNRQLAQRCQTMQEQTSKGFQQVLSRIQNVDAFKQLPEYSPLLKGLTPAAQRIYGSMARVNEYAQSMSIGLEGLTQNIQNIAMLALVHAFSNGLINAYSLLLGTLVVPVYFTSVKAIVNAHINKRDFDVAMDFQKELKERRERDGKQPLQAVQDVSLHIASLTLPGRELPFGAQAVLHKGDIAQICGASGCGKSTLAKAMLNFCPSDGIAINGLKIDQYQNRDLRARVEYVPQSTPILCGTLRENLFLNGNPAHASDEWLLKHPLLQSILESKTLDEEILENGANLSGGEKQKIALVRALLSRPDVLILDEVCSHLDGDARTQIYQFLNDSRHERVTLLIAHEALPDGLVNVWLNRKEMQAACGS